MKIIKASSLGFAWKDLLSTIMSEGSNIKDGTVNLNELCHVCIVMEPNFLINDHIFETYYDKEMIRWMEKNFFDTTPILNWGYSYGQRFRNFQGIDQIQDITEKLKKNPESKSATICLAFPPEDKSHTPCIYTIDFKYRKGQLDMTTYFRSQDAGKKFCADMYCLKMIQENIAKDLSYLPGNIFLICSSMHVYETDMNIVTSVLSSSND